MSERNGPVFEGDVKMTTKPSILQWPKRLVFYVSIFIVGLSIHTKLRAESFIDEDSRQKLLDTLTYSAVLRASVSSIRQEKHLDRAAEMWVRAQDEIFLIWSQSALMRLLLGRLWEPTSSAFETFVVQKNEAHISSEELFRQVESLQQKILLKTLRPMHPLRDEWGRLSRLLARNIKNGFTKIVATHEWINIPLPLQAIELLMIAEDKLRQSFSETPFHIVVKELSSRGHERVDLTPGERRDDEVYLPFLTLRRRGEALRNAIRKIHRPQVRAAFIRLVPFVDIEL